MKNLVFTHLLFENPVLVKSLFMALTKDIKCLFSKMSLLHSFVSTMKTASTVSGKSPFSIRTNSPSGAKLPFRSSQLKQNGRALHLGENSI